MLISNLANLLSLLFLFFARILWGYLFSINIHMQGKCNEIIHSEDSFLFLQGFSFLHQVINFLCTVPKIFLRYISNYYILLFHYCILFIHFHYRITIYKMFLNFIKCSKLHFYWLFLSFFFFGSSVVYLLYFYFFLMFIHAFKKDFSE